MAKQYKNLSRDLAALLISIMLAVYLAQTGAILKLLESSGVSQSLGSLLSGLFFTSIFTTAPAIAALGQISLSYSIFYTALWGALGAVIGDMIIFNFIKDRFSKHLMELLSSRSNRSLRKLFCRRYFKWITFLVGGIIIASPLPDELGISILGFSRMSALRFIGISFVFNFLGIVLIALAARAIA